MEVKDLFGRRYGFEVPKTLFQDSLPERFYNGIKNNFADFFRNRGFEQSFKYMVGKLAWPRPNSWYVSDYVSVARKHPWHETLSSIELVFEVLRQRYTYAPVANEIRSFAEKINETCELAYVNWKLDESYRFVKRIENIATIETALRIEIDRFDPAREHLRKAWELFNKRPAPDYPNSTKEAITAVESAAKIATKSGKGDLGKALERLKLHPALKGGIEKLYAYTSDEPGVRHGGTESPDVGESEAELMLTICASILVFLAKMNSENPFERTS